MTMNLNNYRLLDQIDRYTEGSLTGILNAYDLGHMMICPECGEGEFAHTGNCFVNPDQASEATIRDVHYIKVEDPQDSCEGCIAHGLGSPTYNPPVSCVELPACNFAIWKEKENG